MRRLLTIMLAAVMLMTVAGCGAETFDLALITDLGTIDDKSFNQGSWEGLKKYADENDISHKYYQPSEQSDDAYLTTIDLAVKGGAKLIVTPGFLFATPIYIAQDRYPNVKFVLVDATPHDETWSDFKTGMNTVGVEYAEEQSGFLAGYAAVKDGYTRLGFMGGMAVPAVIRFGYGYAQGAEYAAKEMGLPEGALTLNYHYVGHFNQDPAVQTMAAAWFASGVEIIFGCGGGVGNSVMSAAEAVDAKVIGVDVDQSGESPSVITSAMKGLTASVYTCVKAFYDGSFPGGQNLVLEASNDGVGLPMGTSKFKNFNMTDYNAIYAKLVDGAVQILREDSGVDGSLVDSGIQLGHVVVTEIK